MADIKLLGLDVDGTLTDGGMYISESGDQFKRFHSKDGMGIMSLVKRNIPVGIISSSITTKAVETRAAMLKMSFCAVGPGTNKKAVMEAQCAHHGITMNEAAFIGDDINDLEVLQAVGMPVCPADAVDEVKAVCRVVLTTNGGEGCVREFIDRYMKA